MKHFHQFCGRYNITDPFPISELTLCYFVAYLAEQGLAPQTGRTYLAAVHNAQISLGLPDPREHSTLPLLKRIQAGIRRVRLQRGNGSGRVRLPITVHTLIRIREALRISSDANSVVTWAVTCTAFFGFFRLGELLPLSSSSFNATMDLAWGDVAVDNRTNPRMIQIHLKTSKCDQFGQGADVIVGVTGVDICPVSALSQYMGSRGSTQGPFFLNAAGEVLTKPAFVSQIRDILQSMGIPAHQFAGHSFRIGAATTAAIVGVEDSMIQTLGRWHSTAFLRYIRTPKTRLASVSASLVHNIQGTQ